MRKNKGITLIALVITIIILLILAGVSISTLGGENGILKRAKEAVENYIDTAEREQKQLNELLNETDKIIENVTEGNSEETLILITGITLNKTSTTITTGHTENLIATIQPTNASNQNLIWTSSDTSVVTVQNGTITVVSRKVGETATITATAADGSGKSASCTVTTKVTVDALNVGDYIEYDTGVSTVGKNGVITCRVLYPTSSEYGLQIISDKNLKNVSLVTLGVVNTQWANKISMYNNVLETLNNEATMYKNSNYAYDTRCVGSAPTVENGMFINKNKIKFEGTTEYVVPSTVNYETLKFSNKYYRSTYKADLNYETDITQMQTKGLCKTEEEFWLASRRMNSNSSFCTFSVRIISANSELFWKNIFEYFPGEYHADLEQSCGFRPCLSLKSDSIKIIEGSGISSDSYIMEKL